MDNIDEEYSNRALDLIFNEIRESLIRIENQTKKTNGRVTRLEKILLIVGTVSGTIAVIYYPQIIEAIKLFV